MGAQRYSQLTGSKNQPKSHTAESSCPWDFHEASRCSEPRCRCTPLSRGCLCPALCCLGAESFSSLSSVSAGGGTAPRPTAPPLPGPHAVGHRDCPPVWDTRGSMLRSWRRRRGEPAQEDSRLSPPPVNHTEEKLEARASQESVRSDTSLVICLSRTPFLKSPQYAGPSSGNKKASCLPRSQSQGQGVRSTEGPASSPARDRDLRLLTGHPAERLLLSNTDVRP